MKIRKIINVSLYVVLSIILSFISLYLLLMYLFKPELSEVSYTLEGYQYRVMAIYDYSDDQYKPYKYSIEIYLQNSGKFNCKEICMFFTTFLNSDLTYATPANRKINSSNLRNKKIRVFIYSNNVIKAYQTNHEQLLSVDNDTLRCDNGDTLIMPNCIY